MNREELVSYAVQEVTDLFQAGAVGLYEFIDILRSKPELTPAEREKVAQAAVQILLDRGEGQLVWEQWADPDYRRPADRSEINDSVWTMPPEGPYLAIEPA